jgi:hypothetical protein
MDYGKTISAAFVKAQKSFSPALKTSTNPHFKSRYADLSACVEAVIDALNENGIALMQPTRETDSGVTVETVFLHESGEAIIAGVLHVPAQKQDAQGYGSALTYARRYSLMAACGIAPEDDDGNAASKKPEGKPESKPEKLPAYTDKDIEKNLPVWQTLVDSGLQPDHIVAKIETKSTLTVAQKAKIMNLKPRSKQHDLSPESQEFVDEMEAA